MCILSIIKTDESLVVTSNRDESVLRTVPAFPFYKQNKNKQLTFPKDPKGGGSWITVDDHLNTAILLNGAFKKHIPKPPYSKSRGLILIEIFSAINPIEALNEYDCRNIEPFTIILFYNNSLIEMRWDGNKKFINDISQKLIKPQIWCSATLYDEEIQNEIQSQFLGYCERIGHSFNEKLQMFHQNNRYEIHYPKPSTNNSTIQTVSMSQIVLNFKTKKNTFKYRDLLTNNEQIV